jgi:uncharacterized membrane protein
MLVEVIMSIVAAACFGIATAMQKYSLMSMKKFSLYGMISNRKWLVSIIIALLGIICYLYAIRTTELSTVQPLLAISLVIPVICGIIFFKEKNGMKKWVSMALIIAGVFLVSLF